MYRKNVVDPRWGEEVSEILFRNIASANNLSGDKSKSLESGDFKNERGAYFPSFTKGSIEREDLLAQRRNRRRH